MMKNSKQNNRKKKIRRRRKKSFHWIYTRITESTQYKMRCTRVHRWHLNALMNTKYTNIIYEMYSSEQIFLPFTKYLCLFCYLFGHCLATQILPHIIMHLNVFKATFFLKKKSVLCILLLFVGLSLLRLYTTFSQYCLHLLLLCLVPKLYKYTKRTNEKRINFVLFLYLVIIRCPYWILFLFSSSLECRIICILFL